LIAALPQATSRRRLRAIKHATPSDRRCDRGPAQQVAPPCWFEPIGSGTVASVNDGRNFVLADGHAVRLAAIEAPAAGPAAAAARNALADLVAGQHVELRQHNRTTDRYGRTVAHAFVMREGATHSAAGDLLAAGYALVGTHVTDRTCAAELLAQERHARLGKLGLWAKPYYVILPAERGAALLARRGQFAVVEGKVVSVRTSGGTIYVNFGRRWSQALTVTILKRHERMFRAAGLQPKALENRRIRVRGWIEERNGPRIAATNPLQIEWATDDTQQVTSSHAGKTP
jgi:endonuclease YncB( thermonuclease family)